MNSILRILLCCGAGMSSGFLATDAVKESIKEGLNWEIDARSRSIAIDELPDYDICLLGPHFASSLDEFIEVAEETEAETIIKVIPEEIYGNIDGTGLVHFIKEILNKKKG